MVKILTLLYVTGLLCSAAISQAQEFRAATEFPTSEFFAPVTQTEMDYGTQAVVGKADFEKMRDYPPSSDLYKLSLKIGAVFYKGMPICTGSLVGPDLFLTNEHCAFSGGQQIPLSDYLFSFNYYVEDFKVVATYPVLRAKELVKYNAQLDYALYRLDRPIGNQLGWLEMESTDDKLRASTGVKIIQHPAGRSKEVALKNTALKSADLDLGLVHYFADTEGGSSGSPVFSADGTSIIALHHAGISNQGRGVYNEGILASKVYQEISAYLPASRSARPAPAAPKPTPAPSTRRTAEPPEAAAPAKPAPARAAPAPAPKKTSCDGEGMEVVDDDGNVTCVQW